MNTKNRGLKRVGYISVDAGLCIIGDPCYFATPDASSPIAPTWADFCDLLSTNTTFQNTDTVALNHKAGHEGLAVVVTTGYGDGSYPVYVTRNDEGRVSSVQVFFD